MTSTNNNVAKCFSEYLRIVWGAEKKSSYGTDTFSPEKLRKAFVKDAGNFDNFEQHDSHEFILNFLDFLHEDLNRVRDNHVMEYPIDHGISWEVELSDVDLYEFFRNQYLLRSSSVIRDIMCGK
jgi:ubiquitin C-terminal hydrolase